MECSRRAGGKSSSVGRDRRCVFGLIVRKSINICSVTSHVSLRMVTYSVTEF